MRLAYLLLVQKLEKEMSNSSNECCEVKDRTPTNVKFCNLFCHMFIPSLLPNLAANESPKTEGKSGSKCKLLGDYLLHCD